jgi:hypothetical protein
MESVTDHKICIIGDASFNDSKLLSEILLQERFASISHHASGILGDLVDGLIRRHDYNVCSLKDVTKLLVFYGGEDTKLIGRMKKAMKNGIKVKIIKYKML